MCCVKEIWRPVKGYENLYLVSSKGRVKSLHKLKFSKCKNKDRMLRQVLLDTGYKQVVLSKESKTSSFRVHVLVANAFLPNPNNYPVVNHKDENRQNNNVENLEWCTQRQNLLHSNVIEKMLNATHKNRCKPVAIYKNGRLIRECSSATDAARFLNDFQQNVSNCCHGKAKSVKGYQCKFINK